MAKKGNRVQVILECTEHKKSGQPGTSRYITTKNRKNTPDRLELKKYNPELIDKKRLLAVSKADLLDEELQIAIQAELPTGIKSVFISAVTGYNIDVLKDNIWQLLTSD